MTALDKVKPYAKAIIGFAVPALTAWVAAQQDASVGGSVVTSMEWGTVAIAALVTGGAVFAVPNRDPQAQHQDESVQPPTLQSLTDNALRADAEQYDGYGARISNPDGRE